MPDRSLTIEQVLTLLAQTPPRIAALTAGLTPAQLHTAPNQGEWSTNDVLAHLRSCADVWGNCIVLFYARWLALHERPHIKQVGRIVNTMHM